MPEPTIMSSKKVTRRNLKIMFWGDFATRKTEAVLRLFPHVFLIDCEGNSDQCADNPDIPEYLVTKTKDPRQVLKYIDDVEKGKIKFDDGSPVETLCIDSWTILWSVQQEFANANAEKRATRYNRPVEEASVTQLDWGLAKRPMKQLTNKMANCPVKYLVLTAREKALYADGPDLKKIGVIPDVIKGTEYEMNLCLHFINGPEGWRYETTKVQGMLSTIFPIGKSGKSIPFADIKAYTSKVKPSIGTDKGEVEIAVEQADEQVKVERTQANLLKIATNLGIEKASVGKILADAGFSGFNPNEWDKMEAALKAKAI